jgi:cytochrome c5
MAAAADEARAAAAGQVAYGGTTDGEVIYQQLCGACHTSGAGGAPRMVAAEWTGRIAQGMETLVRHSIEGFQGEQGIMPPRGGNPSLTDEQVEVTVVWMVDNLQ